MNYGCAMADCRTMSEFWRGSVETRWRGSVCAWPCWRISSWSRGAGNIRPSSRSCTKRAISAESARRRARQERPRGGLATRMASRLTNRMANQWQMKNRQQKGRNLKILTWQNHDNRGTPSPSPYSDQEILRTAWKGGRRTWYLGGPDLMRRYSIAVVV